MPNWSDDNGNCHFEVNGVPCYESPDKCPMHGGSWEARPKAKKPTKTTTELTRLRRENADMARALDEAFKRGAEAMRAEAAKVDPYELQLNGAEFARVISSPASIIQIMHAGIRALPIPEDK